MFSTGIKTPVGIKVMGPGLQTLSRLVDDAQLAARLFVDIAGRDLGSYVSGPAGAAKAKEMMLMMTAHQYLLGDMADSDEVKKLAATPEMKKVIADVKAAFKDHATRDRKKNDVANDGDEAMMVVAHALLKQDEEAAKMLKAAEEGH